MITLGPLILALTLVLSLTWPEVHVVAMLSVLAPTALLLPLLTYPLSYTIWQTLDLVMRPAQADDFDVAFILDAGGVTSESI